MRAIRTACVATLCLVGAVHAKAHRVPSEYATINEALDAAMAGDSVLVAPGTYSSYETRVYPSGASVSAVGFLREGVTLISEAGAASTTLRMDGTTGVPSVLLDVQQAGDKIIIGFTLTGTVESLVGLHLLSAGRVVVEDCVFRDIGHGGSSEGAVDCSATDLEVRNCIFRDNEGFGCIALEDGRLEAEDCLFESSRQGAVRVSRGLQSLPTAAEIRRCTFRGITRSGGTGGAVFARLLDSVTVEDCWFEANQTRYPSPGSGGAIFASSSPVGSVVVRGCTFLRNSTEGAGHAGAAWLTGGTVLVEGNTFHGNGVEFVGANQAGTLVMEGGAATFRNNVVTGSIVDVAVVSIAGSTVTSCNVFWGNADGNVQGFALAATDVEADPLYCDPEIGDFTVEQGSPCLPENSPGCGQVGAWGQGCGSVAVQRESWGKVKSGFRGTGEGVR